MASRELIKRGKGWSLRRHVPKRYAAVEPRKEVWISLHTDNLAIASQKAGPAWDALVQAWEALLKGDAPDAMAQFEAAREMAAVRGFSYLPVRAVAELPLADLVERTKAVGDRQLKPAAVTKLEVEGILGTADEPAITVSRALELFWDLAKDRIIGKSKDQIRRWENPRKKASANFIRVVGDKALRDLSPDDMLDFRDWLIERVAAGEIDPSSANKDLSHLTSVWKEVNLRKRLGLALPITGLSLKEGKKKKRPPFSNEWIKTRLLAPGALDGLNLEARCAVVGIVNTGARPSEMVSLQPEHIRLEDVVPHIQIRPVGRQLKNDVSERDIPLVGVSLEALKQCPHGFPTYQFKDLISDTVNKYLDENGLLETPKHSLYSLRHNFEDRMLAAGIDDRIRRDIFGHTLDRERYGDGATLAKKAELLQALAF